MTREEMLRRRADFDRRHARWDRIMLIAMGVTTVVALCAFAALVLVAWHFLGKVW